MNEQKRAHVFGWLSVWVMVESDRGRKAGGGHGSEKSIQTELLPFSLPPPAGPSRRSDLQTLGYCLLKWLYGALPWTKCLPNTEDIMKLKQK